MLVESHPSNEKNRYLRSEEKSLIRAMLDSTDVADRLPKLDLVFVKDMNNGKMGGVIFSSDDDAKRRLGRKVAEAEYIDSDGVLVSIVINLDTEERLFELDFWKVNFSPLLRYPVPNQIAMKAIKS